MDRIGGPTHVRDGILDALSQGIGVTAKISWLTNHNSYSALNDDSSINTTDPDSFHEGRQRWIHCTHLLGSDSNPGVIMIVMVDKDDLNGTLNTQTRRPPQVQDRQPQRQGDYAKEVWPMRGLGMNGSLAMGSAASKRRGRSASQPPTERGSEDGLRGRFQGNGGMASLDSLSRGSSEGWTAEQRGNEA
jgi:hypothetical protein